MNKQKHIWVRVGFILVAIIFFATLALSNKVVITKIVHAVTSWEEVDVSGPNGVPDGVISSYDALAVIGHLGCPSFGDCPSDPGTGTPSPSSTPSPTPTTSPTPPLGGYSACGIANFGTQVISDASGDFIKNINQYQQGYTFTGSPYNALDIDSDPGTFGFKELGGWQRGFIEGQKERLQNKISSAQQAGLENDYEYIAYGPEYAHGAGEEALWPDVNVPEIEGWAEAGGKQLMYAPSRQDYEDPTRIAARGDGKDPLHVLADTAQSVDIWGIQLGFLQTDVDAVVMSETDFQAWISQWHDWIKVGDPTNGHPGNPNTKIVAQIGIQRYDVRTGQGCVDADSPEYILAWRERLAPYVDGIIAMPSQQCQPCPDNPPAGFICTTNPEDIAKYQQAFDNTIVAAQTVCAGQ